MPAPALMAFDLDGTLLFDRRISPEDIEAIHGWQEAGNLAVVCSGKSLHAARFCLEGTGLRFDYSVLFTGGAVADADFQVLMSRTIPNQIVQEVVRECTATDGIMVYGTTLDTPDLVFPSRAEAGTSSMLTSFEPMDAAEIPEHEFVGVPLWIQDEELLVATLDRLRAQYGETIGIHRNQDFIDLVPPHCTKGTGLAWLDQEVLHGRYQTCTIGDSWNDLPMHAWAEHSASFTYSPQEVQEATGTVVSTAAEYVHQMLEQQAAESQGSSY